MKNKLIYTILFLLLSIFSFGQSKILADRYFKEFAYPKAAELYKSIYKKGDDSMFVIERIAKCHYNNSEVVDAELWYSKLVANYKSRVSESVLFEYAQSIRSNGNYKKSDSLLSTLLKFDLKDVNRETKFLVDSTNIKNVSFKNLDINTKYSDFGGFIHNDKVYYASSSPALNNKWKKYKWNGQPFLNLYTSSLVLKNVSEDSTDKNDKKIYVLKDKEILSRPVTTRYHESNAVFTKDGKTMYFTRLNSLDGSEYEKDDHDVVNLKIYKAILVDNEWTNIKELPFNSKYYSVGHPALSVDEKTLYFVSDMPTSIGKTDIYKVSITKTGYGNPVNLGKTINTLGKEMFPYVSADNILYFSSDGHAGLGLLDVFLSKIGKDETSYSEPLNLQVPFNSKRDDFSFNIDTEGRKGFLSSNRENGKGDDDIYSFTLEQPLLRIQSIAGVVKNKPDTAIMSGAIVKLFNADGKLIQKMVSDEKGAYIFSHVPCSKEFTVRSEKLNYKPDSKKVSTTEDTGKIITANLSLQPMVIDNQIVIKPIYFDFDKYDIREDAKYELEYIVTVMNNNPKMIIHIESHTDSRASKSYNRILSTNRAISTRDYILSRGIDAKRILSAKGYGEDRLLNHCNDANIDKCSEKEHQLNRRSYYTIVEGVPNVTVKKLKPTKIDRKPEK